LQGQCLEAFRTIKEDRALKFGILGAAHGHIASFAASMIKKGHTFVGIYDPVKKRTESYVTRFSVPVFDSPEDLLKTGAEVVGTSAVNNTKIDVYELCESYGAHVIADKPVVTDYEQYERLKKIIERGRIQIGLLLTLRFSPPYVRLKSLIDEGALGDLLSFEFHNPHNLNPSAREDWHFSNTENGGLIIDLIIHCADLLNWYVGDVKDPVYSATKRKTVLPEKETFFDYADVYMQTQEGITAFFKTGWLMPECASASGYRVVVSGSKGTAVIDNGTLKVCCNGRPFEEVSCPSVAEDPTADFLLGIEGKERLITHEAILKATKMTLDMDKAARIIKNC
jgi:predicted dehydrogenase